MEENKKDVLPLEGEPLSAPQISTPVVNALVAALNKIETYVPTQYIDDGPPDIDADHLNHAEQAIMRVTNLANGAADAISALQSQVTQLNNNLVAGTAKFPKTSVGTQEIIIDFPYEMETVPVVLVSWKDTTHIFEHMDGLVVTGIEKTRFKVASRRKIESYDWGFSYLAICR